MFASQSPTADPQQRDAATHALFAIGDEHIYPLHSEFDAQRPLHHLRAQCRDRSEWIGRSPFGLKGLLDRDERNEMPAPIGVKLPARILGQIYANTFARAVAAMPKTYHFVENGATQEYRTVLSATIPFCISQRIVMTQHEGKPTGFGIGSLFEWKDREVKEILRIVGGVVDYSVYMKTFVVIGAKEREAMTWRQRMDLAERCTPIVKNTYRWNVKFSEEEVENQPQLLQSDSVPAELKTQWEIVTKGLAPSAPMN